MSCNSCKNSSNVTNLGGLSIPTDNSEKSVGVKILIFTVKIMLFLIASVILIITVIPFSIYLLVKVIFFDGRLDIGSFIGMISNHFKNKREEKKYKKESINENDDEDDEDDYEDDYSDIDEIK